MRNLSSFCFFYLVAILCLSQWLFTNFQIFPGSRALLPFFIILCVFIFLALGVVAFISIPVIYLFRKKPNLLVWNMSLSAIVITVFYFFILPFLPRNLPMGSDLLKFDSAAWKTERAIVLEEGNLATTRQKMLKDLLSRALLDKTREEIVELLGPPTETFHFQGVADMIYVLGPERDNLFGRIDYEWLLIWLDNGGFKKYRVVSD